MTNSYEKKSEEIKKKFSPLSKEERYHLLMQMGKHLKPYPKEYKIKEFLVPGCQSQLYLHGTLKDGKLFFQSSSESLISAGLAALLIELFSGHSPELILTTPPTVINELEIPASLTLSRSNGFANIHLKMKQIALHELTHTKH